MKANRVFLVLCSTVLVMLSACQPATPKVEADLVIKNATIYTVDKDRTVAQAMAIKGDSIVYIGDDKGVENYIAEITRVIDLQGKLVLPGLIDSHAHVPSAVSELYEVWLYGIGSVEEYQQALTDFTSGKTDLQGVQGGGWINAVFGPSGPTAAELDVAVADIPAVLYSEDYHSVWVNSKALELAGVTKETPDPEGGIIERDADGNPSGTLRESAADLVADVIPPYSNDQLLEGLRYFQEMAHSLGMTTVYIPSASEGEL
ncbi:MAG: amidohydrolase family protein [Anaerolineae bacterium]|nr:amidohydrolase family protein [Anaerolineae bacterium]